jgi:hypothetical protein
MRQKAPVKACHTTRTSTAFRAWSRMLSQCMAAGFSPKSRMSSMWETVVRGCRLLTCVEVNAHARVAARMPLLSIGART